MLPIIVNDGVACYLIEPALEAATVFKSFEPRMDLYEHVLENIINVRLTSNPLLDEATKIGVVLFPNLFCVSHGKKKGQIEVSPLFLLSHPDSKHGCRSSWFSRLYDRAVHGRFGCHSHS